MLLKFDTYTCIQILCGYSFECIVSKNGYVAKSNSGCKKKNASEKKRDEQRSCCGAARDALDSYNTQPRIYI